MSDKTAKRLRLLASVLVLYAALCVAVYAAQDLLLFPGRGRGRQDFAPPRGVGLEQLAAADGSRFRVAVHHQADAVAVLLFFVGNGQALPDAAVWARAWGEYGISVVVPEYPGYGRSGGEPSEQSIAAAAEAATAKAAAIAEQQGVPLRVGGASLGSFPALHAARALGDRCAGVLLLAPFTSVLDVARRRFWFLPVSWLLRRPFDNVALLDGVRAPILVVHGEDDAVVPFALGERLARAAGERARLLPVPGAGHNDLQVSRWGPLGDRLRAFLCPPR